MLRTILIMFLIVSVLSCSKKSEEAEGSEPYSMTMGIDTSSGSMISSSAAVENNKDTTRKFIRTAELKFKVKSVVEATNDIERITGSYGGFVSYTDLKSSISHVATSAVNEDSSLESTHYTVTNDIIIRIPNTKLDTILREIAKNVDFLDYRVIKAEDVSLEILSNNLTQKRAGKNEKRLTSAIDSKGKKLGETADAEEVVLSKQEQADQAKIANMAIADKMKFSRIDLTIYQRPSVRRELIQNPTNIEEYEPAFGHKLLTAFKSGWDTFESLLVFLVNLWAVFLFVLCAYLIYRRYGYRLRRSK